MAQSAARLLKLAALAGVIAYAAHSILGIGGAGLDSLFENWVYNGVIAAGAALALLRAASEREERLAWGVLGVGLACWAAGEIVYTLNPSSLDGGFPSTSDLLWLVLYPASFAALLLLVRARVRQFFPSVWLDGLLGALTLAALTTQFVFPPIVAMTGEPGASVASDLIYPVGDLLLMVFAVAVLAVTGWRPDRRLGLVSAGLALGALADTWSLYWSATGHSGSTALDALWPASALMLGWAAWSSGRSTSTLRMEGHRLLAFPVLFALAAIALLVLNGVHPIHGVAYALAVAALGGVVVRMAITFSENLGLVAHSRHEALSDALTGLGNRRKLLMDLDEAMSAATPERSCTLVAFDLNGFKRYNDTYGHPAGDALLATLGSRLSAAVGAHGSAYRLGGDEFCALYGPGAPATDILVAAARAALSDRGDGLQVTAAYGALDLPREAADVTTALQIADERLYVHKRSLMPLLPPTDAIVAQEVSAR